MPTNTALSYSEPANDGSFEPYGAPPEPEDYASFPYSFRRVDETPDKAEDSPMASTFTREELDAKFERTEARVDLRLAAFQSAIDASVQEMRGEFKTIHADLSRLKNLKANIWGATGVVVATVIATVLAVAGLGFGAFESGRNTASLVNDAQRKVEEISAKSAAQQAETQQLLRDVIKAVGQPPK